MLRTKATPTQLNRLIEYMKENPECAAGRANCYQGRVKLERQWNSLSETLNALGGPEKSVDKWKQTWRDLRSSVKKKLVQNKKDLSGDGPWHTGNDPSQLQAFTVQEGAVISAIGSVAVARPDDIAITMPVESASSTQPVLVTNDSVDLTQSGRHEVLISPACVLAPSPPSIADHPVSAQVPLKKRMRARRRPTTCTENFYSQILSFEKKRLDLKSRKIEVEEKNSVLKEAKVKALERIANALEKKNNK